MGKIITCSTLPFDVNLGSSHACSNGSGKQIIPKGKCYNHQAFEKVNTIPHFLIVLNEYVCSSWRIFICMNIEPNWMYVMTVLYNKAELGESYLTFCTGQLNMSLFIKQTWLLIKKTSSLKCWKLLLLLQTQEFDF